MNPAYEVHRKLENYIGNQNACFDHETFEIISTSHLSGENKNRALTLINKKILRLNEIKELLKYPTGIMFLELGGRFHQNDKDILFYNDKEQTCWDNSTNLSYIQTDTSIPNNWHMHPWNAVGYGYPNFFSSLDIENAFKYKNYYILFVGNPFVYRWPFMFKIKVNNYNVLAKKILEDLIVQLKQGTPFLDPQIDWKNVISNLKKNEVYFDIMY